MGLDRRRKTRLDIADAVVSAPAMIARAPKRPLSLQHELRRLYRLTVGYYFPKFRFLWVKPRLIGLMIQSG